MSKINIGVLRGGKSDMYEASLKTGANIIKNLSKEKYKKYKVNLSAWSVKFCVVCGKAKGLQVEKSMVLHDF
jgi:D-alanine-D-alanine ligase-like ATP-grasp enzyme